MIDSRDLVAVSPFIVCVMDDMEDYQNGIEFRPVTRVRLTQHIEGYDTITYL